jgi:hypothetical protein
MLITIVVVLRSYFQKSRLSLTLPISDAWFWDGHVKQVLENGGFPYVERHHKEGYIAAHTLLSSGTSYLSFSFLSVDWSDDERVQFKNEILNSVQAIG